MQFSSSTILRIVHRSAFVIVIGAAALAVVYVLVANLFLSLGGVGLFFRSTNQVDAKFASAWTIVPGVIHVRDLRVVFQDHNVQWSLDFSSARLTVDLPRLASRTFHARSVRGEGVVFRLRHRVDPWSAKAPSARALPPIPEFPSPPVFEARVQGEPVSDADYDLWTVHVEDVDIAVRELWIQQFRYVGEARAGGSFYLRPARWLWVGPATLTLDGAPLTAGPYTAAERLEGEVACTVHPHDIRLEEGRNVFRFISSRILLAGEGASSTPAALFLPERFGLAIDEKSRIGRLAIDAAMEHGVLLEHSSVEFEQYDLDLRGNSFDLRLDAIGFFAEADPPGSGRVRLEASGARLLDGEHGHAGFESPRLEALLTSSSLDAAESWALIHALIQADDLAVRPSRCGPRWTASSFELAFTRGLLRHESGLRLPLSLSASNVRTRLADKPLRFDFDAENSQVEIHPQQQRARLSGSFRVHGLYLPMNDEKVENWWARVDLDAGSRRLDAETELTAAFRASLRDGTPLLAVLADEDEIPNWLVDVLPLRELEAEGRFQHRCEFTDVQLTRARGGPLTFRGRLQRQQGTLDGALLLQLDLPIPLSAGVEIDRGKTAVSLGPGSDWLGNRLQRLEYGARQNRRKPCEKSGDRCAQ